MTGGIGHRPAAARSSPPGASSTSTTRSSRATSPARAAAASTTGGTLAASELDGHRQPRQRRRRRRHRQRRRRRASGPLRSTVSGNSATAAAAASQQPASLHHRARDDRRQQRAERRRHLPGDRRRGATSRMWSTIVARRCLRRRLRRADREPAIANVDRQPRRRRELRVRRPGRASRASIRCSAAGQQRRPDRHARARARAARRSTRGDAQFCGASGTDQRRAPVVGHCDIGAFEFGGRPPDHRAAASRGRRDGQRLRVPGHREGQAPRQRRVLRPRGRPAGAGRLDLRHEQGPREPGRRGPAALVVLPGRLQARPGQGRQAAQHAHAHGQRCACGNSANARPRRSAGCGATARASSAPRASTARRRSSAPGGWSRTAATERSRGSTKGKVRVRDFRARRTVVVRAGKQYFARAR